MNFVHLKTNTSDTAFFERMAYQPVILELYQTNKIEEEN
jgi:hypothetical protein